MTNINPHAHVNAQRLVFNAQQAFDTLTYMREVRLEAQKQLQGIDEMDKLEQIRNREFLAQVERHVADAENRVRDCTAEIGYRIMKNDADIFDAVMNWDESLAKISA